jgi:hypothetical protein
MSQPITVIVATVYKPLVNLLERAMQGTGATVRQVDPNADIILNTVGESPNPVVVLFERKGHDDWLNLAKVLHDTRPELKTLAFGQSTDTGAVARGIVHGLVNHVPLACGSNLLEIRQLVANAIAGVDPPADSIYGRVKAMLPSGTSGTSFRSAGKTVSAEDAVQQCIRLGLTPDETSVLLGVSPQDANKFAGKACGRPRVGQSEMGRTLKVAGVVLILGLALLGLLGRRRSNMFVPVTGTVRMNGVPLGDVIVFFSKEGGSRLSSGKTDRAGKYSLSTLQKGDGAESGRYVVWLGVPLPIREHIEMNHPQYAEKMVRREETMRGEGEGDKKDEPSSVPASYRDMRSSPLRAEIKGRDPIRLDFDLKN